MRVLAFDPGKSFESFAYAIIEDGTIIRYGRIQTIRSLLRDDFEAEVARFIALLQTMIGSVKPDVVIGERFLDRGGPSKGSTGEFICIALGLIASECHHAGYPFELVMPATWKGWLARTYFIGKPTKRQRTVVKNMLEHLKVRFPVLWPKDRTKRLVIHEADAMGIALWRYETEAGRHGTIDRLIDHRAVKIDV